MSDPKLIAITGASGLIGKALTKRFRSEKVFDGGVDDCDALVHLAGETVDGHWSSFKKRLIYESRVQSTKFLVEKILSSPSPPKVVVFASAIGFYGQKRADWVTEESPLAQDSWQMLWKIGNKLVKYSKSREFELCV